MSTKFERFKDSYFKHFYPDGPDLAVLDELDEKELKEAEALLIASLKPNEVYLIQALGHLRSQKALPKLVELLPQAKGMAKVYVAEALWRINNYEPALVVLCETLTKQGFFRKSAANVRREAAIALREVNDKRAIEALKKALKDKDELVQAQARRSLAVLLGVRPEFERLDQIIRTGTLLETRAAWQARDKLIEDALENYEK